MTHGHGEEVVKSQAVQEPNQVEQQVTARSKVETVKGFSQAEQVEQQVRASNKVENVKVSQELHVEVQVGLPGNKVKENSFETEAMQENDHGCGQVDVPENKVDELSGNSSETKRKPTSEGCARHSSQKAKGQGCHSLLQRNK